MDLEATLTPRRRIAVNLRANLAANAAHCERQITETYKTEELLHGLWKQKQMKERGVVLGTFSERQQVRLRAERGPLGAATSSSLESPRRHEGAPSPRDIFDGMRSPRSGRRPPPRAAMTPKLSEALRK